MPLPLDILQTLADFRADACVALVAAAAALWWGLRQRRRLRAQLARQAEALARVQLDSAAATRTSQTKCEFLAELCQDLRSPLQTIQGATHLLGETGLDEAQREHLGTVVNETGHLEMLLDDILDYQRIERGELTLEAAPFSPVEVARDTLRRHAPRAEEKRLDLRFEAQVHHQLLLSGDARRFRRILSHLIDNAIRFTPFGSITLYLTWQAPCPAEPCGRLTVRVRDTGVGLSREQQAWLFEPDRAPEGTAPSAPGSGGLGLALVQRLTALMGGEVSVQSQPGAGADVRVAIPLPPIYQSEHPFDDDRYRRLFPRPPRILIVDDLETNRFLLDTLLRRHGFAPELASNGEEAVRLATTRTYDAILMDLVMPDLDGFVATARIRQSDSPGRHTPIIALTASLGKGTRFKCLAAGMDEEMTKPLDVARFKQVLVTVVGARRGGRTAAPVA